MVLIPLTNDYWYQTTASLMKIGNTAGHASGEQTVLQFQSVKLFYHQWNGHSVLFDNNFCNFILCHFLACVSLRTHHSHY